MMNKILIVEDDPAIQEGLKEILLLEGYEVITTCDGREGVNIALKEKPDLLLLDINLPSLNGLEVTRRLREKSYNNPIIILTSKSEQIDKIIGLEMGADDYITKPFDTREVIARIRANIRQYHSPSLNGKIVEVDLNSYHRHLLTVLFSDIVDYSKKMNMDEENALKLLIEHNMIMRQTIPVFNGRIIEIIGDAILSTFESTIDAVECSIILQQRFVEFNNCRNEDDKIEIRIGIHLGDVIEFEKEIKGDTVNIAARIQQQCVPGKIYISQNVYDVVKNKVKSTFIHLGKYQLKNISDSISLYELSY